jgi:ribosomal protein S18 acetylase RimI-like enzyme
MRVRNASIDDCAAIAAVHVKAWQSAYRGHMPDEFLDSLSVAGRTEMWRKLILQPGRVLLVADDLDGSIRGFCALIQSRDADAKSTIAEIAAIYVSPDDWGQGIGQKLLSAAVSRALGNGFSELTLWVLDANQRARRFYEKFGFAPDGSTKEEDRGSFVIREVRYRKPLQID